MRELEIKRRSGKRKEERERDEDERKRAGEGGKLGMKSRGLSSLARN